MEKTSRLEHATSILRWQSASKSGDTKWVGLSIENSWRYLTATRVFVRVILQLAESIFNRRIKQPEREDVAFDGTSHFEGERKVDSSFQHTPLVYWASCSVGFEKEMNNGKIIFKSFPNQKKLFGRESA